MQMIFTVPWRVPGARRIRALVQAAKASQWQPRPHPHTTRQARVLDAATVAWLRQWHDMTPAEVLAQLMVEHRDDLSGAEAIRAALTRAGLTLGELATLAGVTDAAAQAWARRGRLSAAAEEIVRGRIA